MKLVLQAGKETRIKKEETNKIGFRKNIEPNRTVQRSSSQIYQDRVYPSPPPRYISPLECKKEFQEV